MTADTKRSYKQLPPTDELIDFVDSYWESKNFTDTPFKHTILPDSFFKIIIQVIAGKITAFFLTGLWPEEQEITIPAGSTIYGVKFKILAPEYIFSKEIGALVQSQDNLDSDDWNILNFDLGSLQKLVDHLEPIFTKKLSANKQIPAKKLQLSRLLYHSQGDILAKNISDQVSWSNRQINRYLNKYLGVSLKKYLNIQRIYAAYIHIREGNLKPSTKYYDQSHYIKQIKQHTGHTPGQLYKEIDDRFIQLKHLQKE